MIGISVTDNYQLFRIAIRGKVTANKNHSTIIGFRGQNYYSVSKLVSHAHSPLSESTDHHNPRLVSIYY